MNYEKYQFNVKDWAEAIGVSVMLGVIIAYLFFNNWIGLIIIPAIFVAAKRYISRERIRNRQQILSDEFMDALKNISSNLIAGYSLENAFIEAERELLLLKGKQSYMYLELREMNRKISMNQPIEKILEEFSDRTGLEDIQNFSDIFSFAKRSGGKFVEIIETTTYRMWEKFETRREIEVTVSAKKLEQKIMDVIPVFILLYLRIASGDYLDSLYSSPIGMIFMTICLGVYVIALFLAEKVLDIRV